MIDNVKTPVNTEAKEKGFDSEQASYLMKLFSEWIFDLCDNGVFEDISFERPIRSYSRNVSISYFSDGFDDLALRVGKLRSNSIVFRLDYPILKVGASSYFLTDLESASSYKGLLYCPFSDLLEKYKVDIRS